MAEFSVKGFAMFGCLALFEKRFADKFLLDLPHMLITRYSVVLSNHRWIPTESELDNYKLSCHNKREDKSQHNKEADDFPHKR